MEKVFISEIFGPTIQGEGRNRGVVSTFIRFSRCNLNCPGFKTAYQIENETFFGCDTWYAVDGRLKESWSSFSDTDALIQAIQPHYKEGCDVVITGGEPLLYWHNPIFQAMLLYFFEHDSLITIETNGTIACDFRHDYQKAIMFSISPKLANSGEPLGSRLQPKVLQELLALNTHSYLKFVVSHESIVSDEKEILTILEQLSLTPDVFIMPLTHENDIAIYQANSQAAVELCTKYNYIYSNRDHILIWDGKKGV